MTETISTIVITSTLDLEKEKQDFQSALGVLEKGGLIGRTSDGKIYMTKKGKNQQYMSFSIKKISHK